MSWTDLGTVTMGKDSEFIWQNPATAGTGELIRITWVTTSETFPYIQSRVLLRRNWGNAGTEPAILLYPSIESQIIYKSTAPFVAIGLSLFDVQVKRLFKWRKQVISEPVYDLKIENQ